MAADIYDTAVAVALVFRLWGRFGGGAAESVVLVQSWILNYVIFLFNSFVYVLFSPICINSFHNRPISWLFCTIWP
jgi:hypothetical protein